MLLSQSGWTYVGIPHLSNLIEFGKLPVHGSHGFAKVWPLLFGQVFKDWSQISVLHPQLVHVWGAVACPGSFQSLAQELLGPSSIELLVPGSHLRHRLSKPGLAIGGFT